MHLCIYNLCIILLVNYSIYEFTMCVLYIYIFSIYVFTMYVIIHSSHTKYDIQSMIYIVVILCIRRLLNNISTDVVFLINALTHSELSCTACWFSSQYNHPLIIIQRHTGHCSRLLTDALLYSSFLPQKVKSNWSHTE